MARFKKSTSLVPAQDGLNESRLEEAGQAADELAVLHGQDASNTKLLAAQLGYQGPLDPDSLERVATTEMTLYAQGTFRLGAALLLLRESCLHGDFLKRIDRLGLTKSSAYRYMSIAAKFRHGQVRAALQGFGVSKLVELTALDDSEIHELIEGKSARGITVDKIETLSLRELRQQFAEAQKDAKAKDDYIRKLNEKMAALEIKYGLKVAADTDWPAALEPITAQIAAAGRAIAKAISDLETCRITLMETGQALEADLRPKYQAALLHVADVYAAAIAKAERDITKERATFDKSLGMYGSGE